jgi:hypothetical protein
VERIYIPAHHYHECRCDVCKCEMTLGPCACGKSYDPDYVCSDCQEHPVICWDCAQGAHEKCHGSDECECYTEGQQSSGVGGTILLRPEDRVPLDLGWWHRVNLRLRLWRWRKHRDPVHLTSLQRFIYTSLSTWKDRQRDNN